MVLGLLICARLCDKSFMCLILFKLWQVGLLQTKKLSQNRLENLL